MSQTHILCGVFQCIKSKLQGYISIKDAGSVFKQEDSMLSQKRGPNARKWKDEKVAGVVRGAH